MEENKEVKKGGRPKGAKNTPKEMGNFKRKLREYTTEEEVLKFVRLAKKYALTDKKFLMFLLEQLFGKARNTTGLEGGEEGSPIKMFQLLNALEEKDDA